ncbi:MAG: helix-turn-helix domain-containing protein [Patescibacteria group bacterium]
MGQLQELLEKCGLSNKATKVYLAMLEIGSAPVHNIASKAKLNRSTTYVILNDLMQKGLLTSSEDTRVKLFTVASPERLIQFLEESVKQHAELVGLARKALPELKAAYSGIGPKPRIQYFEGLEGLKNAYDETLKSTETIKTFASIDDVHEALGDYFPDYYYRRASRNIKIDAIFPDTPASRDRVKKNKQELREAYLIPKNEYSFSPEIMIYEKKLVILSLKEKFAFIIESEELADAMKKIFKLAWAEARRLNKKLV